MQDIAATRNQRAPISLRVNPNVDAKTHPYISTGLKENKFGIAMQDAANYLKRHRDFSHLDWVGLDCHIGSQLTEVSPFVAATTEILSLALACQKQGLRIRHLDLGGGLGVCYQNETPPTPDAYLSAIAPLIKTAFADQTLPEILLEPGRAIVATAGIFLTRVEYLKHTESKNFLIVDGAMNDLVRPSLYQAWMRIENTEQTETATQTYDVVGPVCETGDFLGKERAINANTGDLLVVHTAGAYGFSMSSNYNSRNRAAEVMVHGNKAYLIRRRETFAEQMAAESTLPE